MLSETISAKPYSLPFNHRSLHRRGRRRSPERHKARRGESFPTGCFEGQKKVTGRFPHRMLLRENLSGSENIAPAVSNGVIIA